MCVRMFVYSLLRLEGNTSNNNTVYIYIYIYDVADAIRVRHVTTRRTYIRRQVKVVFVVIRNYERINKQIVRFMRYRV